MKFRVDVHWWLNLWFRLRHDDLLYLKRSRKFRGLNLFSLLTTKFLLNKFVSNYYLIRLHFYYMYIIYNKFITFLSYFDHDRKYPNSIRIVVDHVPEILNVHVNENNKKIDSSEKDFFFSSNEKFTFEKGNNR